MGEVAILEVNGCRPNEVISRCVIIVHHCHCEGVVCWQGDWNLKHLPKHWIQVICNKVLFIIDGVLSNLYLDVWIRLWRGVLVVSMVTSNQLTFPSGS